MSSHSNGRKFTFGFVLALVALAALGAAAPFLIYFGRLQTSADGGGFSWTNLAYIQITNYADLQEIRGNATNQFGSGNASQVATNYVPWQGVQLAPSSNQTNYWFDFGRTNQFGAIVYQTVVGTNDVHFIGPTNSRQWALLSINVIASGGNRIVSFPTNLPHLNTNGLSPLGTSWQILLNSGNEFRITIESNINNISTIWGVFGQSTSATNFLLAPTNTPTDGFSIFAAGANSKWASLLSQGALVPTNSGTTGYVLVASGTNSAWVPNTAVSSNSVIQTLNNNLPVNIPAGSSGLIAVDFSFGDNQRYAISGSIGNNGANFYINSFLTSNPNSYERHEVLVWNTGTTNIPLAFGLAGSQNWIWLQENGSGSAPNNLAVSNLVILTLRHRGGNTNVWATYRFLTNAIADY